jgi:hypothetical protein
MSGGAFGWGSGEFNWFSRWMNQSTDGGGPEQHSKCRRMVENGRHASPHGLGIHCRVDPKLALSIHRDARRDPNLRPMPQCGCSAAAATRSWPAAERYDRWKAYTEIGGGVVRQ